MMPPACCSCSATSPQGACWPLPDGGQAVAARLDECGMPAGRRVRRRNACSCWPAPGCQPLVGGSSRSRPGVPGPAARAARATRARARAPEMAFMFMERNAGTSTIDYPVGGSRAIVDALVRGIRKHGGRVLLRAPVEQILIEGARRAPAAAPRLLPGGRRGAGMHAGTGRALRAGAMQTLRRGLARDGACSRARRARRRARGGRAAGAARRARGRGRARGRRGRQQRVRVGHAAPAAARRRAGGLAQRGAADAAHWQLRAPACRCGPQPACAGAGGAPHTPYMRPCAAGRCIRRAVAVRDCAPSACSRFMCMARGPAVHACGSLRCCAPAAGSPEQCGACECWCGRDAGAARLTRTLARVWPRPSSPELPPSCRSSAASAVRCNAKQQRAPAGAGIDADGLPPDLECHHLFVNSWEGLDAPQACGPAARAFRGVCGGCRDARMTEHWAGQSGCGRRSRRITCIVGVQ